MAKRTYSSLLFFVCVVSCSLQGMQPQKSIFSLGSFRKGVKSRTDILAQEFFKPRVASSVSALDHNIKGALTAFELEQDATDYIDAAEHNLRELVQFVELFGWYPEKFQAACAFIHACLQQARATKNANGCALLLQAFEMKNLLLATCDQVSPDIPRKTIRYFRDQQEVVQELRKEWEVKKQQLQDQLQVEMDGLNRQCELNNQELKERKNLGLPYLEQAQLQFGYYKRLIGHFGAWDMWQVRDEEALANEEKRLKNEYAKNLEEQKKNNTTACLQAIESKKREYQIKLVQLEREYQLKIEKVEKRVQALEQSKKTWLYSVCCMNEHDPHFFNLFLQLAKAPPLKKGMLDYVDDYNPIKAWYGLVGFWLNSGAQVARNVESALQEIQQGVQQLDTRVDGSVSTVSQGLQQAGTAWRAHKILDRAHIPTPLLVAIFEGLVKKRSGDAGIVRGFAENLAGYWKGQENVEKITQALDQALDQLDQSGCTASELSNTFIRIMGNDRFTALVEALLTMASRKPELIEQFLGTHAHALLNFITRGANKFEGRVTAVRDMVEQAAWSNNIDAKTKEDDIALLTFMAEKNKKIMHTNPTQSKILDLLLYDEKQQKTELLDPKISDFSEFMQSIFAEDSEKLQQEQDCQGYKIDCMSKIHSDHKELVRNYEVEVDALTKAYKFLQEKIDRKKLDNRMFVLAARMVNKVQKDSLQKLGTTLAKNAEDRKIKLQHMRLTQDQRKSFITELGQWRDRRNSLEIKTFFLHDQINKNFHYNFSKHASVNALTLLDCAYRWILWQCHRMYCAYRLYETQQNLDTASKTYQSVNQDFTTRYNKEKRMRKQYLMVKKAQKRFEQRVGGRIQKVAK